MKYSSEKTGDLTINNASYIFILFQKANIMNSGFLLLFSQNKKNINYV